MKTLTKFKAKCSNSFFSLINESIYELLSKSKILIKNDIDKLSTKKFLIL